jgi:hypothetical protein
MAQQTGRFDKHEDKESEKTREAQAAIVGGENEAEGKQGQQT